MEWLMTKQEDDESSRLIICFENDTEKQSFMGFAKKAISISTEQEVQKLCGEMPVVSNELNRFRDDEVVQTVLFENSIGEHWPKLVYYLTNTKKQLEQADFTEKQEVQECLEEITDEFLAMRETFRDFKKSCTRAFAKKQANHERTIEKLMGLSKVLQAYELLFDHYITEKVYVQKAVAEIPQNTQKEYYNVDWQQKFAEIKAKRMLKLKEAIE